MKPVRFAVIGLGGFAAAHIEAVEWLEQLGLGKLSAVIALPKDRRVHPELVQRLRTKGVRLFSSIADFWQKGTHLADVLTVPIGIHEHAPVTLQALNADLHVYCEKPAAATIQEVDQLIQARNHHAKKVVIGFQYLFSPALQAAKKLVCTRSYGRPLQARVVHCWPRSIEYFRRNAWAGKLRLGKAWVLDSPANNAMAHFIMNLLYLASWEEHRAARPQEITAELYRVNPIESADTVQFQFRTDGGLHGHVILTHATAQEIGPLTELVFEKGKLVQKGLNGTVELSDGRHSLVFENTTPTWRFEGFRQLVYAIQGKSIPLVDRSLELARMHTLLINGMHESAIPVADIPEAYCYTEEAEQHWPPNTTARFYRIRDLEAHVNTAMENGEFFSAMGIPWARAGSSIALQDYHRFPRPDGRFARYYGA